jgi:hypothetical protein
MFKAMVRAVLVCAFLLPLSAAAQDQTEWYVATNGSDATGDGSASSPFQTIQYAIDAAGDGDMVIVLEGSYTGPGNRDLDFKGKAITVRSRDPDDDACMRETIIDAEGQGVIVRFVNDEGPESIFEGFTLGAGDTSKGVIRGEPGFFEFSKNSRPTTRRLRNQEFERSEPAPTDITLQQYPGWEPPYPKRAWEGYNPFHQPAATTDYHGSGDVNKDGDVTWTDASRAQAMANGTLSPVSRADVDGDGDVDSTDVSLINSALSGGTLPGWWNSLASTAERNHWIDRVLAIDQTDQHIYYSRYFQCHHFAYQTFIHGALLRGDFPTESTEFDGGQTVFNVPMYYVHVSPPTSHAINAIMLGNNPLVFDDWRFIEPQTDLDVTPGAWNMRFNSDLEIEAPTLYGNPEDLVIFHVDEAGWSLVGHSDNLVTTRSAPSGETPDNRPDLWNPNIVTTAPGMLLYEQMREDLPRTTDIHLADLPFVDPPAGTPLVMGQHFSGLLDIFPAPDGTIRLLWESKDGLDHQNGFHGKLNPVNRTLYDVTQVSSGRHMINRGRIIVTPNGETHIFWMEYNPWSGYETFSFGIYWTRWNGSGWQSPQHITPDAIRYSDSGDWINRQFYRFSFDVDVLDSGDIIIVWLENLFPWLNQLRYDGSWSRSTIEFISGNEQIPGIDTSKSPDGILHLAYWVGPSGPGPGEEGRGVLLHRTFDGSNWSAPVTIDGSGNACCPRMAVGPDGEVYMVWERREGEQVVPVWNTHRDGAWGTARSLPVRPEANAWYPAIDVLPNGRVIVTWSSRSPDRVTIEMATVAYTQPVYSYLPIIMK